MLSGMHAGPPPSSHCARDGWTRRRVADASSSHSSRSAHAASKGGSLATQLRAALEAQRASGSGTPGSNGLSTSATVSEEMVTKALALQWSCPVLTPEFQETQPHSPSHAAAFLDAFGASPARCRGKGSLSWIRGGSGPRVGFALERMAECAWRAPLCGNRRFRPAHRRMLAAEVSCRRAVEAASGAAAAHPWAGRWSGLIQWRLAPGAGA